MIALARVLRPHGVRGEVAVALLTSSPQRLLEAGTVWLGRQEEGAPHTKHAVRRVRTVGRRVVVQLEDILDVEAAEAARGLFLMVPDQAVAPLPPGQYYQHDIVGCAVVDELGTVLGTVREVLEMPAQDIYVVARDDRAWWLPAAKRLIKEIDVAAKRITVEMVDGLLDTGPSS